MKRSITTISAVSAIFALCFCLLLLTRAYADLSNQNKKLKQDVSWLQEKNDYLDWRISTAKGFTVDPESYKR